MTFTASVRTQVNTQVSNETRTVPASVVFEPSTTRLHINVGAPSPPRFSPFPFPEAGYAR